MNVYPDVDDILEARRASLGPRAFLLHDRVGLAQEPSSVHNALQRAACSLATAATSHAMLQCLLPLKMLGMLPSCWQHCSLCDLRVLAS